MFTRAYKGVEISCDTAEELEGLEYMIARQELLDAGLVEVIEINGEPGLRLTQSGREAGMLLLEPDGGRLQ
jgi:hypothetical protein